MKKKLVLFLLTLSVVSLTACGSSKQDKPTESSSKEVSSSDDDDDVDVKEEDEEESEVVKEFNKTATIEETVLLDENNIRITAKELTYTDATVDLSLHIENNSDVNYEISSNSAGYACNYINEYMIPDGYLFVDVESGNSSDEVLSFAINELETRGIYDVAILGLGFSVSDDDFNSTDYPPVEVKTSIADSYSPDPLSYQNAIDNDTLTEKFGYSVEEFSDDVAYDQDGISVKSVALIKTNDDRYGVFLEVVDSTDNPIYVDVKSISVNGTEVYDSLWSRTTIYSGKSDIISVDLDKAMDAPQEVEDVSFLLDFYDMNGNVLAESVKVGIND